MTALPKSKYLEFFLSNQESIKEMMETIGNIIVLEKIKLPEMKTASGIILAEAPKSQLGSLVADRPTFYRVVHVGEGYYKPETMETVPLNSQMGDIVLIASASVKHFSSFPLVGAYEADSIGIAADENVQIRFKGQEAFERFLVGLDAHVKGQLNAVDSHAKAQISTGQNESR
jgi:co-chaperonin GroES (HSP10)